MEDSKNNLTTKFPVVLVENEFNSTEEQLAEHLNRLTTIVPIVVPILFTLVIVIGFIGNLLVVLVVLLNKTMRNTTNILIFNLAVRRKCLELVQNIRGERERLFGSREREGKLKITFPFYGKGTGIRKLLGEGKGNLRLVIPGIPGNPGNHIKSKIKFKIIFMP